MKATLQKKSKRYEVWLKIFGTDTVDVLNAKPHKGRLVVPGTSLMKSGEFYQLDVPKLSPQQRMRVVRHLSEAWRLVPDKISEMIDDPTFGVPLLSTEVVISKQEEMFKR